MFRFSSANAFPHQSSPRFTNKLSKCGGSRRTPHDFNVFSGIPRLGVGLTLYKLCSLIFLKIVLRDLVLDRTRWCLPVMFFKFESRINLDSCWMKISKLMPEAGVLELLKLLCYGVGKLKFDCAELVSDLWYFWARLPRKKLRLWNVHTHAAKLGLEPWHGQQMPGLVFLVARPSVKACWSPAGDSDTAQDPGRLSGFPSSWVCFLWFALLNDSKGLRKLSSHSGAHELPLKLPLEGRRI